ncbi:MAG: CRISPR-associated protein Cas4 [Calditrichaceae bacterium]
MADEKAPLKITPTDLLQYYFCPRFIYFMHVLKISQNEDRRYKVQKGREVHEQRLKQNKEYLWKKIGAVDRLSDVYLISDRYHLYGIVDEVVTFADGSMAPVDYKFAVYPEYIYRSHKIQLISYCMLLEEVFEKKVEKGYIFYVRNGNKQVEVPYTTKSKHNLIRDIEHVVAIIQNERQPKPTSGRARCADCTYKNICVR